MYRVVQKMKRFKKVFRRINKDNFDIEKKVYEWLQELKSC